MPNTEDTLVTALLDALSSATKLRRLEQQAPVRFNDEDDRPRELDATLRVSMPDGQELELAIEVRQTAYPRDVRLAVEQLWAYESSRSAEKSRTPLLRFVVAEHLSEDSRNSLRKAGINYFDASGTLHFLHDTWLVEIERPPKAQDARRIGSIFAGAREQVVHAMLNHWRRTEGREHVSGAELAQLARTSAYTVSKTMREMEHQDWLQSQGSGPTLRRRLREPAALLDAWAAAWNGRSETRSRWHVFAPDGIVRLVWTGLANQSGWAMTGAAAANLLVPYLTTVDRAVFIVPPGKSADWADELELRRADKGANVVFIEREGASQLFVHEQQDRPGLRFASPFVQYLDLLDGIGRNKELATEIRRRYLKIPDDDAQ